MLTTAQKTTLKAAIAADPVLSQYPNNSDGAFDISRKLDEVAVPQVIVWRTAVPKDEITMNGFDWTRLDNLSVGKARVWDGLFDNAQRITNPAKPNVRAGIETVWTGTAADLAVRAAVYEHCKRPATRAEAMFAVGTGTALEPSVMAVEGSIPWPDVLDARSM